MPKGSESHFKVIVVSEVFEGQKLLARHRLVNATLAAELDGCARDSRERRSRDAREPIERECTACPRRAAACARSRPVTRASSSRRRPVHALSIVAKTPAQWEAAEGAVPESPACMGGSKR